MGIVRDLFYAKKMSAGVNVPASSSAAFMKRRLFAKQEPDEGTFSGSIVNFIGGPSSRITSLYVAITPEQAGSGSSTPDNVRQISGHNEIEIYISPTTNKADGTTYTVDLQSVAGTVYDASIEVVTGKLILDTVMFTKNTANMNSSEDYPGWKPCGIVDIVGSGQNRVMPGQSNVGSKLGINTLGQDLAFLNPPDYNNLKQTQWIAKAIDFQFLVDLAYLRDKGITPMVTTEYDLSPQEVTVLSGKNYMWSNAGDVTVTVEVQQ